MEKTILTESNFRQGVNRFITTFSAAFRCFYLYQQDNRAFEEIMQNLARRFQESVPPPKSIKIGITNRSFVFEGLVIGNSDVTIHLSGQLRNLGYKEIIFQSPVQNRNFFQFLHIISSKDSDENKNEKLLTFLNDGEPKPISLVPITANNIINRMPDQLISHRLAALSIPEDLGGKGFLEKMAESHFESLPDFYNWICIKVEMFPSPLKVFSRNIVDATREGHFPFDRFVRVFPIPRKLRDDLRRRYTPSVDNRPRKESALGHDFTRVGLRLKTPDTEWNSRVSVFTEEDVSTLQMHKNRGEPLTAAEDLDLAESLLKEKGSNFILGLCFLMRHMNEKNPVAVQEKALRIAVDIWGEYQSNTEDVGLTSLLSSLRQSLTLPNNVIISLFPLRNATMDSFEFKSVSGYVMSLGKAVIPGLVAALEGEQDRGMRKKLCHLITNVTKQFGIEPLIAAMTKASPFLLRNIVMILGDLKHPLTIPDITPLLRHSQKMVRIEAVKTLCKIGNEESIRILLLMMEQATDLESKQIISDFFVQTRYVAALDAMMRTARHPSVNGIWRRTLYNSIASLGGPKTRLFFEQIQKESSFMTRFNPEQKEDLDLIKNILVKMGQ